MDNNNRYPGSNQPPGYPNQYSNNFPNSNNPNPSYATTGNPSPMPAPVNNAGSNSFSPPQSYTQVPDNNIYAPPPVPSNTAPAPNLSASEGLVLLADFSENDWLRLFPYLETRSFSVGETLIAMGERDRSLFLVTQGKLVVAVPYATNSAAIRPLATIEAGGVIGEQAFLDGKPRSALVRATSAGQVMRFTFQAFQTFASREPQLAQRLLFDLGRILSERLRQANATISILSK